LSSSFSSVIKSWFSRFGVMALPSAASSCTVAPETAEPVPSTIVPRTGKPDYARMLIGQARTAAKMKHKKLKRNRIGRGYRTPLNSG
jgi:hypothetical protein